jgi:hypothetical protein
MLPTASATSKDLFDLDTLSMDGPPELNLVH